MGISKASCCRSSAFEEISGRSNCWSMSNTPCKLQECDCHGAMTAARALGLPSKPYLGRTTFLSDYTRMLRQTPTSGIFCQLRRL